MFQDKGEPALDQLHGGLSATRENLENAPVGHTSSQTGSAWPNLQISASERIS